MNKNKNLGQAQKIIVLNDSAGSNTYSTNYLTLMPLIIDNYPPDSPLSWQLNLDKLPFLHPEYMISSVFLLIINDHNKPNVTTIPIIFTDFGPYQNSS